MENVKINVLHLDGVKEWRGGQQQVYYLLQGMQKNALPALLACQPGADLQKRGRDAGFEVIAIPMRNEADFLAGWRIARFCNKRRIDILHAHSAHALAIAIWARLFYQRVKIIAARRVDFSVRKSAFSILKYDNRFVDRIICISKNIQSVMLADGLPAKKLVQIYDGIDLEKYAGVIGKQLLHDELNIPEESCVFGTIAAFSGQKGYPTFLKAANLVLAKRPDIHFVAVGSGKDEVKIRKLAYDLKIDRHFHFTGYQKDVGPYLKSFDVFVAASRKEGLGTSVLDALAAGLPVIGTDAGGIPESVQDGINGLLVPKQNPEAMAAAILKLAGEPALRKKLAANAPASVKKFAIENTVSQTIALYKKLLENEPHRS